MITRRDFSKIVFYSAGLSVIPKQLLSQNYKGPINWVGSSFLTGSGNINNFFPISKKAFEILMSDSNASFFNYQLTKILRDKPLKNVNLSLQGFEKNAKLALTFGFGGEFDYGFTYDDEIKEYQYLLRIYSYSVLYDPNSRTIISSYPVRYFAITSSKIGSANVNQKSEMLKYHMYNEDTPNKNIVYAFRKEIENQSFVSKKWQGRRPKVTEVSIPTDPNLYKTLKIPPEKFKEFIGQETTFAYGSILKSPIIPYIKTKGLGVTTISRFDAATKLYQKVAAKLPNPDVEIKVIHQGWEFYEEKIKNLSDLLSVELGMGIQIIIYDTFEEVEIYNQFFVAAHNYFEKKNNELRSDDATLSYLTAALLDRVFRSIIDQNFRKTLFDGEEISTSLSYGQLSYYFKLDSEDFNNVSSQSNAVLKNLPI